MRTSRRRTALLKPANLVLLATMALTLAWSSTTAVLSPAAPHDIKNLGVHLLDGDVSADGVAALQAAPAGVGVPCVAGVAGPYACSNTDLLGLVTLAELGGAAGNDSWGWEAADGTRIAIMGTGRNVAYVDVTDPTFPEVIGRTDNVGGDTDEADGALWRDVKVAHDHAYIVSERGGGIQVVDLNEVLANRGNLSTIHQPVTVYTGIGTGALRFDGFHNIVVNEETSRLYPVGVDSHNGRGMFALDITDPANPQLIGKFDHGLTVHDAQCTIYRGPDTDYNGDYTRGDADGDNTNGNQAELCFTFDEDEVNIVDFTIAAEPVVVNTINYVAAGSSSAGVENGTTGFYAHQGWLTRNHDFLLFNDELDELATRVGGPTGGTNTYYVELADLDAQDSNGSYNGAPVHTYTHPTSLATDHNMYVVGDLLFQANYTEGLRVMRVDEDALRAGEGFEEVGFFDVDPGVNAAGFSGAWNVFPFFGLDNIIVSSLDEGMYTLQFNDPAAVETGSTTATDVLTAVAGQ